MREDMEGVASGSCGEIRRNDADISSAQREVEPHEIKKEVFTSVMPREWVEKYKKKPSISTEIINLVGDAILHLAILVDKHQDAVIQLMKEMDKGRMESILQSTNEWGNTPLHQAAIKGMDEVCSFIARHYCTKQVVLSRNKQGETPLHVAVLHGQKRAFFALQMVIEEKCWGVENRKNDGSTILHSAILREHFGE